MPNIITHSSSLSSSETTIPSINYPLPVCHLDKLSYINFNHNASLFLITSLVSHIPNITIQFLVCVPFVECVDQSSKKEDQVLSRQSYRIYVLLVMNNLLSHTFFEHVKMLVEYLSLLLFPDHHAPYLEGYMYSHLQYFFTKKQSASQS